MNFFMKFVFGLLSRKMIVRAKERGANYAFMFVRPDGGQLAQIGALLEAQCVVPVIDKVRPFDDTKAALAYLGQSRARWWCNCADDVRIRWRFNIECAQNMPN